MDAISPLLTWLHQHIFYHTAAVDSLVVILATLLVFTIHIFTFRLLSKRPQSSAGLWNWAVIHALRKPLGVLIWTIGISLVADIVAKLVPKSELIHAVHPIRKLLILATVVWFFMRLIRGIEQGILTQTNGSNRYDKTTVHAICQLAKISTLIMGALMGLQLFSVPISGVLAFGGIGGAAVAFAAKDLLGNFFGGLMVYLDRPFTVGDWIYSPDKDIEGVVEQIGWRLTRLRSLDKRPVYVPNGLFSMITLQNPSRMSHRRIRSTIGLRYEDAPVLEAIINDIEELLRHHPDVDPKQRSYARFTEFADSSLNIQISAFTKSIDSGNYQLTRQQIFFEIIRIVQHHGADFAFPTQTVHLVDNNRTT